MARDQMTTPKGVFKYCYVNTPDVKGAERFGGDAKFKVTVVIEGDDPKWPALKEKLDSLTTKAQEYGVEQMDEANPKAKASWKKRKITEPEVNEPYSEELDEDGNPTGRIELAFKTNAEFKNKKTGVITKRTVPFRDGKGQVIPAKKRPLVYGGTVGRVAFSTSNVFIPKDAAVYLGLYLNEIQISQLATAGSGEDPFGEDEDSDFSADDLEEYEGNASDDDGDDTDGGDDGFGGDDGDGFGDERDLDDEIPF